MKKAYLIIALLVVANFALSLYFYNIFPDKIATNWNAEGEADGYGGKFWGLFLLPGISIGLLLLYFAIPYLDPLRKNIAKFRAYFDGIFIILFLFFIYIHILSIVFNLGYTFNFSVMIAPAFGILMFAIGIILENSKRNWFVGIRTPWTLSSDLVWDKTHRLGGRLFEISGVLALIGILFPKYVILLIIVPIFVSAVASIVYSYIIYKRLNIKKSSRALHR